jgi:exopolysaccharide biosynthesis polyprenyl glycosylphosphotransferase
VAHAIKLHQIMVVWFTMVTEVLIHQNSRSRNLRLGLGDILHSPNRSYLFIFDFFLASLFFLVSVWLSPYVKPYTLSPPVATAALSFSTGFVMFALGLGYYERVRRFSFQKIFLVAFLACSMSMMLGLSVVYFYFYEVFGRLTFIWGAIGAYLGLIIVRVILVLVARQTTANISIIGKSSILDEIKRATEGPIRSVYGFVAFEKILNDSGHLDFKKVKDNHISELVFSKEAIDDVESYDLILEAKRLNIKIVDEVEFYAQEFEKLPIEAITNHWLVNRSSLTRNFTNLFFKRLFDLSMSFLGLIVLSPLLLFIALMIKLTSRGPVLFVQPRQGLHNKPFDMIKFRTMYSERSCVNASGGFTKDADSRVTLVGRILRPLHLDELPQLINIFKGEMSIVGPRPEALNFARSMSRSVKLYDLRYMLQPGLTGHAQILAGYMLDNENDTRNKISFDLYYLAFGTIFVDFRIIIRTLFVVLKSIVRK